MFMKSKKSSIPNIIFFKNEDEFTDSMFRLAFGILFIFIAITKIRAGYTAFAESLANPIEESLLRNDLGFPILYLYGIMLPALELLAGVMLILDKYSHLAYELIAFIYLSFIFGQAYNGNASTIGSEYLPSLLALSFAYAAHMRVRSKRK